MPFFRKKTPEEKAARELSKLAEKIQKEEDRVKLLQGKLEDASPYFKKALEKEIEKKQTELKKLQEDYDQKSTDAPKLEEEGREPVARSPRAPQEPQPPRREEHHEPQRRPETREESEGKKWWHKGPFRPKTREEYAKDQPPHEPATGQGSPVPSPEEGWFEQAFRTTQVYITEGSFIYDTVKSKLYRTSPPEEVRLKLEGNGTLPLEEVRQINEVLRKEIEQMPKVDPKTNEATKEITYAMEDGQALVQTTGADGKYDFNPSANFTGTLSVNRTDDQGKILDDQVDIIHFKDGKVASLIPAERGNRMFNSLGAHIERAARDLGASEKTGVNVAETTPQKVIGEVLIEPPQVGAVYTQATPSATPGQSKQGGQHTPPSSSL